MDRQYSSTPMGLPSLFLSTCRWCQNNHVHDSLSSTFFSTHGGSDDKACVSKWGFLLRLVWCLRAVTSFLAPRRTELAVSQSVDLMVVPTSNSLSPRLMNRVQPIHRFQEKVASTNTAPQTRSVKGRKAGSPARRLRRANMMMTMSLTLNQLPNKKIFLWK